jgi:hypothetical protein
LHLQSATLAHPLIRFLGSATSNYRLQLCSFPVVRSPSLLRFTFSSSSSLLLSRRSLFTVKLVLFQLFTFDFGRGHFKTGLNENFTSGSKLPSLANPAPQQQKSVRQRIAEQEQHQTVTPFNQVQTSESKNDLVFICDLVHNQDTGYPFIFGLIEISASGSKFEQSGPGSHFDVACSVLFGGRVTI